MVEVVNYHAALIKALGGKARLAEALGLDRDVLSKWHRRGIPSRYWHHVLALAAKSGIAATSLELEQTKPGTVPVKVAA